MKFKRGDIVQPTAAIAARWYAFSQYAVAYGKVVTASYGHWVRVIWYGVDGYPDGNDFWMAESMLRLSPLFLTGAPYEVHDW